MTDDRTKTTVLLGFAEALSAPEVVWSLVDHGFRVIAFARRGRYCALRHSRHVICHEITPPALDLPAALADLRALLASLDHESRGGERVLMPLDDPAVWMCSRVALQSGWVLAGPHGDKADLALNKYRQIRAAEKAGLNVPETRIATAPDEALNADVSFPLILKAANAVSVCGDRLCSRSNSICANGKELDRALSGWTQGEHRLVQPFILGTGEGVFGVATPEGVEAWSSHRRLRMMNPAGSGSSACISQPVPGELKAPMERFVRDIGWRGLFMIELLRDRSGKVWFMELNGRSWGSMALARRQALEYPAWGVSLALNRQSQLTEEPPGISGIAGRHLGRELMHLLFVLRGPKSEAQINWPSFWKAIGEIARVRPGEYFYNWRKDDPKVFISDCYYSIRNEVVKSGR